MKRYRSIDAFRGFCMIIMIGGHLLDWWLTTETYWFFLHMKNIFGIVGATGFLFVSGVSTNLSYKQGLTAAEGKDAYFLTKLRNIYMFRALLILVVALIYNSCIAIAVQDLKWIWTWFVLQTIAISLIMAWPLLKASKIVKMLVAIICFIVNQILFELLVPFQGQPNAFGVFYHIIFNPIDQYIILHYFGVFLFGAVIGETIYDVGQIEDKTEMRSALKSKLLLLIVMGTIIMIAGIVYDFPLFFAYGSFQSIYYSLGVVILMVSALILNEEFEIMTTKKRHRFFSFYSYYSFTIYLAHYPLYFLFYRQLDIAWAIIICCITFAIIAYILLLLNKKVGKKASLKAGISLASFILATMIEKKRNKNSKKVPLESKEHI